MEGVGQVPDLDGFVKILADSDSDEILGIPMIGARCADLISEAVVAMEYKASAEDIKKGYRMLTLLFRKRLKKQHLQQRIEQYTYSLI